MTTRTSETTSAEANASPLDAATILRIIRLHEKFVAKADYDALSDKCERCDGKGYHHGFGEDGCDPDWCDCYGGLVVNAERFDAAEAEFIARALLSETPDA